MIQWMLVIWSLAPLPFIKPAWTAGISWLMYCWSLGWRILSVSLLTCEICAIVWQLEHSLALPFFGIRMKTDLFQSCGHCWVFQICWHTEGITLTESSSRIWNRPAEIPIPPLALFLIMLPKALDLTSHSRMYGSRWVTTLLWFSRSLRPFLYSSSIYSCHFLITMFPLGPCCFCPLLSPSLHEMFPWHLQFPIFLKRSLVFPFLLVNKSWSLRNLVKERFVSYS